MKKINNAALVAVTFILFAFTLATSAWKVKGDGSTVSFSGGRIHGTFGVLKADIVFDKEHPEQAKISAWVETESLATGFFLKNSHAKDALGADKYTTIKFVSTSVSKSGAAYLAKGNLTMKGVTKPTTIHFTFDEKGNEGEFKGEFKVIPKEYGIDRSGTPDEVTINLVVPVTK